MSSPRIAVLDVDGTLVDSNYQHALAWYRAFRRFDETFPVWRIHRLIGMGGDQLVAALGGHALEQRIGDDVRQAWTEEVDALLPEISLLPDLYRNLAKAPTLLVTEYEGALDDGAVVNFVRVNNLLKYELSLANANKHGVVVGLTLRNLAHRVEE